MRKWLLGLAAFVGLTVLGAFMAASYVAGSYNRMVAYRNDASTSWGQVETQVQRRFDLLPNLASAAKGIFEQERAVFGAIADARRNYASAKGDARVRAANQMEGALARLLVVIENYPQLRSNEQVQALMDEIAGTENRVNIARQRYNVAVNEYNTNVQTFPTNVLAGMFHFEPKPLFEADKTAQAAPKLNLSLQGGKS